MVVSWKRCFGGGARSSQVEAHMLFCYAWKWAAHNYFRLQWVSMQTNIDCVTQYNIMDLLNYNDTVI